MKVYLVQVEADCSAIVWSTWSAWCSAEAAEAEASKIRAEFGYRDYEVRVHGVEVRAPGPVIKVS